MRGWELGKAAAGVGAATALLSKQRIQQKLMGLPNTSQAVSIGTNIIVWPWTFMVCSCTVFPLGVLTDIMCEVFASAAIGASNAAARRKESERFKNRIGISLW
jgi:hypothetical protein